MTPTTPEQAREIVATKLFFPNGDTGYAITSLADQVGALTKERDELRLQIDIQAGSIEAVQAANQRLAANHKECVRCLGEALQDTTNVSVERDALMSAAKLAVAALDDWYYGVNQDRPKASVFAALQALKKAGVQ